MEERRHGDFIILIDQGIYFWRYPDTSYTHGPFWAIQDVIRHQLGFAQAKAAENIQNVTTVDFKARRRIS